MPIYWETLTWEAAATLMVGALTVGAAVVIGQRQLEIGERQASIQREQVKQKGLELRIMLFQRRLETWTALNDAVEARMMEILEERIDRPRWPVSESLRRFWVLSRELRLLFSPPIFEKARDIEAAMLKAAMLKAQMQSVPADDLERIDKAAETFAALEEARQLVERLRSELFDLVDREARPTA